MRLFRYRIIRQAKHLDPDLFLLNCRALRPRPNRLLDMKTDAAACRKSLRRLVRELGTYAYK
jgi:hypothetical protein